jgi:hypothetical protein
MRDERLEVSVTFEPAKGYVATVPDLAEPITALSAGGAAAAHRGAAAARQCRGAAHPRRRARVERDQAAARW